VSRRHAKARERRRARFRRYDFGSRKERLMNNEDVGGKDVKFAYTGMALIIAALIIVTILS